ncbi:MAG: branched-chain-amino-acid transaminase [Phycisphaerae bacterium]
MSRKVWIDGTLYDKENAKVSVFDHGLLYGDGVFEGIRVYNGKIFEQQAHVDRLYESAKAIRLTVPLTPDELVKAMQATVEANGLAEAYIRLLVTRGAGTLGLDPNRCPKGSVIIIVDTIRMYPVEMYEHGMSVITASVIRNHPNALSPRIKSLNYLNNILAKIEAADAGVPEAIMLNVYGRVAEATGDNVFILKNGVVYTPPSTEGSLEGITQAVLLRLCERLGLPAERRQIERYDLYTADEIFLTGTAAEVIGVTKIDGRTVGDGQVGNATRRLRGMFLAYTRGEAEA